MGSRPLADDQLDYLRRLPAERRVAVGDELVLACHASPGSQTSGLPADLDAAVTVQRVTRTDARVICCGHTHVADVRELGRKLLVNPGSCGYAFDGTPDACWALLSVSDDGEPQGELFRTDYDPQPAAEEVASAACPAMSTVLPPSAPAGSSDDDRGRGTPRGRDRPRRGHAARAPTCRPTGGASWQASPASGPSRSSMPRD